ncbi:hydroxymethylglutaryl-CoA synthase family protein [Kibdelosporangium philippinense]
MTSKETSMRLAVGIDDLTLYGSTLAVDAAGLASARGTAEREIRSLELVRRSLPPSFEDPVTLAVNAARPLTDPDDPERYGLLVVATESGVDYAKPLSSYVHKYLELSHRCRHLEVKHACYAGTAALRLASAWVHCNPTRRALVITTDMARRLFHDPAEPAEGAGAAAMVVAAEPRVLALEPASGVAAREVYDVMRPTPSLETIHSGLSLGAYLDLLELAWDGYREDAGADVFDTFSHVIYHTPITSLVRQAHGLVVEAHRPDVEPSVVAESFERMVRPSLKYCQELGNTYSGSLWAALAALVDHAPSVAAGERIGLYSYGSGSCAEFFSGRFGTAARETVGRHQIGQHLASRRLVDVADYERIVLDTERSLTAAHFKPDTSLVPGLLDEAYTGRALLVLEDVRDYYRTYGWS